MRADRTRRLHACDDEGAISATQELAPHQDMLLGVRVKRSRGLVHAHDACATQGRAHQAHQLLLAN